MRILSHEVFSVSRGGHGNKAENENEGRTEARTVVTVGGRGPGLLMQGQSARDEGLPLLLLCSGFKAVAARAGSGSHLQNEVEDAGWDEERKSGRLGHRVDSRDESKMSSWWLLLFESLS